MHDSILRKILLAFDGERRSIYLRQNTSDLKVFNQIFGNEDFDLSVLKRYDEILNFVDLVISSNKSPLIIDGGANIGISALFFASEYRGAKIAAVEPDPNNFVMLDLNTANLFIDKYQLGITSAKTKLNLDYTDNSSWGVRTKSMDSMDSLAVQSIGINELYLKYGEKNTPFIVKLDVEGAESEIFSSNTEWIEYTPVIIIELHDWMLPKEQIATPFLKAIALLERDFIILGENIVSISHNFSPKFIYSEFCNDIVIRDNFPDDSLLIEGDGHDLIYVSNPDVLKKIKLNMKKKIEYLNTSEIESEIFDTQNLIKENFDLKAELNQIKTKCDMLQELAQEIIALKKFNTELISRGNDLLTEVNRLKVDTDPSPFNQVLSSLKEEKISLDEMTNLGEISDSIGIKRQRYTKIQGEYISQKKVFSDTSKIGFKNKVLIFIDIYLAKYPVLKKFIVRLLKLIWWTITFQILNRISLRLRRKD